MVTVGLYYDVLPGKSEAFVAKFRDVLKAINASPGHKESSLYRNVDDPDSYAILSEWDDQDAFMSFIRSDAFKQVTTWGREEILRQPPRHKIYPRSENLGRPTPSE